MAAAVVVAAALAGSPVVAVVVMTVVAAAVVTAEAVALVAAEVVVAEVVAREDEEAESAVAGDLLPMPSDFRSKCRKEGHLLALATLQILVFRKQSALAEWHRLPVRRHRCRG